MLGRKLDTVEEFWGKADVDKAARLSDSYSLPRFERGLANYIGVDEIFTIPSARWGLEWVLKLIFQLRGPGRVMVPAFNCNVVAESIIKAGHKIEGYDFFRDDGLILWAEILARLRSSNRSKPVAVIISHFFGVPSDWFEIRDFCKSQGIYLIEDCAHTLGGTIQGKHVGTECDASIFSFNYDKPISLGWGGALVLNETGLRNEWISSKIAVPFPDSDHELALINEFMAAMRCRREEIGSSILAKAAKKLRFPVLRGFKLPPIGIGPIRAQLGIQLLERYDDIRIIRNRNAAVLRNILLNFPVWQVNKTVQPAWLKLKVNLLSDHVVNKLSKRLQSNGYRVGNWNWSTLIDNNCSCKNALSTSRLWVDFPIHQNMTDSDFESIKAIIDASQ